MEKSPNNLKITVRERGKIVAQREGHNIWVNLGRVFLTKVMSFQGYSPDVPQEENLPRYIGFGIGGKQQNAFGIANVAPCLTHYPGTNDNLNIDPEVTVLERPARITWTASPLLPPSGSPPSLVYQAGDVWLRQVTLATHPTLNYSLTWACSFSETDFSSSPFSAVPLSEIGLFLNGSDPGVYNNTLIAYDTFDTITKTGNFSIDVTWTVRF